MFTKKNVESVKLPDPKAKEIVSYRVLAFDNKHFVILCEPLFDLEKATAFCCNLFPLIVSNLRLVQVSETKGEDLLKYETIATFIHDSLDTPVVEDGSHK